MSRLVYKKAGTVTPAASDSGSGTETCTIITNHRLLYRGYIHTAYTSSSNVTQPIQWSSEYADTDLGLIFYNYRHYSPLGGRRCGRDRIGKNSCEWERC